MRFLFVDRILQRLPGSVVRGIKHVTQDDYYLCPDEKGRLCFVSSLIGEALGQLAAWQVMFSNDFTARPVAGVVSSARLYRPAYVGETLLLESCIDSLDDSAVQYHATARVSDEVVFSLEGALGPLLPMSEFIDQTLVKQQFAEIDRPGQWPPVLSFTQELLSVGGRGCAPLMFDRISAHSPGVSLCAEKRITRAAAYFPDHFPNRPVLPMTVLIECTLNLVRVFAPDYQIHEIRKIKMNTFIYPGDVVCCYLTIKQKTTGELILTARNEVDGKRVCVLDVVMRGGHE